jgi:hypothetical protein
MEKLLKDPKYEVVEIRQEDMPGIPYTRVSQWDDEDQDFVNESVIIGWDDNTVRLRIIDSGHYWEYER